MTLTDESPMPFGKHWGTKMANVPASYLLWFRENTQRNQGPMGRAVLKYIEENLEVIKSQLKK